MSGPIVRKYGFANFEKIFGKRDIQHGADTPETQAAEAVATKAGASLPPDVAHHPVDPNAPESSGEMAPSTEFGATGD